MTLTPFDIPPRNNIVPLHRGASVGRSVRPQGREPTPPPVPANLSPIRPTTVERKGMVRQPTFDELARAAADFPDLYAAFRAPAPTWRSELAEDFRDFVREVRRSPYSHALVAVLTVVAWSVLLVAPLVIGEWWS